jgi:transposase-like protein
MGDFERKSDGRRIFNTEFKRQAVERIRPGDTTVAALSRELSVRPALIRRWIKLSESGSVPSPATHAIADACKEAGVVVSIGVNERDDETLYNTQLLFDADGMLIQRHRKISPTYYERMVWGQGDGSGLERVGPRQGGWPLRHAGIAQGGVWKEDVIPTPYRGGSDAYIPAESRRGGRSGPSVGAGFRPTRT